MRYRTNSRRSYDYYHFRIGSYGGALLGMQSWDQLPSFITIAIFDSVPKDELCLGLSPGTNSHQFV